MVDRRLALARLMALLAWLCDSWRHDNLCHRFERRRPREVMVIPLVLEDQDVIRMHYDYKAQFLGAELIDSTELPRYRAARDALLEARAHSWPEPRTALAPQAVRNTLILSGRCLRATPRLRGELTVDRVQPVIGAAVLQGKHDPAFPGVTRVVRRLGVDYDVRARGERAVDMNINLIAGWLAGEPFRQAGTGHGLALGRQPRSGCRS
jgi:hypothetical protein